MPSEFTVRGVPIAADDGVTSRLNTGIEYRVRAAVSVAPGQRAAGTTVVMGGDDDDIVEIEDAEGFVTFHRAARLVEQAPSRGDGTLDLAALHLGTDRGGNASLATVRRSELRLPADLARDIAVVDTAIGRDIDVSGVLHDGLGMVAGRLPRVLLDPVARAAMLRIVARFETPVSDQDPPEVRRRGLKTPGVYQIGPELLLEPRMRLDQAPGVAGTDPWLVLLHGTFSNTEAAFADLRDTPEWKGISARYPGRILALEHRTLGLSPTENARDLAPLLPAGSRLHLISHSRGGLVGEALCYGIHEAADPSAYAGFPEHPDLTAWPQMRDALRGRAVTVERFARVACPARGTTLASRRLDRWASVMFNVFKLVPVLRQTGIAMLMKQFAMAMLDQRTDPRVVPGIEAQMPESPFLRTLLRADPLDDALGAVTGDVEGRGLVGRLKVLVPDLFYREQNDYVVPTRAMNGGAPRTTARSAAFRGIAVDHFSYFENVDSRAAVAAWLAATAADVPGFEVPSPPSRGGRDRTPTPVGSVLVVPDLLGSELTLTGSTCWPSPTEIARADLTSVLADGANVAESLVDDYDPLLAALEARHAVVTAAYDPRRSLADAAVTVGEALDRCLIASTSQPVHLVGHGVGALVLLQVLARPETMTRWRASRGRAVLLGPPLDGSWLANARTKGLDELTALLALLTGSATAVQVGEIFARWPLLADLDPTPGDATRRRAKLLPPSWEGITAIYGTAARTICGVADDGTFVTTSRGDGQVLHPTAAGTGPVTWFATVPHADLPGDPASAAAVVDVLAGRRPQRMLSAPRMLDDGEATLLPDFRGELLLPAAGDLTRAAWGGSAAPTAPAQVLRVEVVHGDLRSAGCPVLVGHQSGTPISGAEKSLDRHLHGALERRSELGQYPGAIGQCEVFADTKGPAAAVLGLGDAGDLTPRALASTVSKAVLKLAACTLDGLPPKATPTPLTIASVLIGTSLVPATTIENSVTAIVSGVRQANRRLQDVTEGRIVVERLQIMERYEERAIQAAKAAVRLAATPDPDAVDVLAVERRVIDGCDGVPGSPRPDYQEGIWRTIRIVAADEVTAAQARPDDLVELSFTSIGRSARAEQTVNVAQRAIINALVQETIATPTPDDQLLNTLYELILPNAVKDQGYGSENLMLVIDGHAASLPLEMLATRTSADAVRPLCVDVGVVRRLETPTFSETVRSATGRAALVIGDPAGTGQVRLPGANREAKLVASLLRAGGYEVTEIVADRGVDTPDVVGILNALYRREYRIVHIAGHGRFDSESPTRSGVLIGSDIYLGALEIAKMRSAPQLVFLNCCHLGAMTASPNQLAAGISRRLIENGVRGVVAAGWAVDDAAARTFAERMYGDLLDGADLGDATHRARDLVYRTYGGTNTWGAYQVYGPPGLRLKTGSDSDSGSDAPPVARRELYDVLTRLRGQAGSATGEEVGALGERLEQLLGTVPTAWVRAPEHALVGQIWGTLAQYERAVASYERAQADWSGSASLKIVEQLANMRAKWAVERSGQRAKPTSAELIGQSRAGVQLLLGLGPTPERYELLGSVERRDAQLGGRGAVAALKRARDAYHRAVEMHGSDGDRVDFYPALNEVVLDVVVAHRTSTTLDTARAEKLVALARADIAGRRCRDFWCRAAQADADLALALLRCTLPDEIDAIFDAYSAVFEEGSSRQERLAVVEHVDVIASTLRPGRGAAAKELVKAAERLGNRLRTEAS